VDRWTQRLYGEGIVLFNRAQFFEAHEVWEDAWRPARGDDRALLHGVIQIAAGFHKLQCGQPSGAVSLLDKGIGRLRTRGSCAEVPDRFVNEAEASRRAIAGGVSGAGADGAFAFPRLVPPRDGPFLSRLLSDITVAASAERVWSVLTRFDEYPLWNPFLLSIRGEARAGTRLSVRFRVHGVRDVTVRTRLLRVVPRRELRWRGRLLLPGLYDGEHVFSIAPLSGGRVRFSQRETFTGVLVPALGRALLGMTGRGFHDMNRALKERAERPGPVG